MKVISTTEKIKIPSGVTVALSARTVTVSGPRGSLTRSFSHTPIEFELPSPTILTARIWFGARKHIACLRTICSHVENMIKGVTLGYIYKMRSAYAHFPINLSIVNGGKCLEIRNYLGEKRVRRIPMLDGVKVEITDQKDEIQLLGNSIEAVSQSAASIQQATAVKDKDVRKFLDGIYVSERTTVVKVEA